MVRELTNIVNHSIIEQGAERDILSLSGIKYNSDPLGSGSFGAVYKVVEVNQKPDDRFVIKIYNPDGDAEHASSAISLLHKKIRKEAATQDRTIYQIYPGLMGLPFAVFKGSDEIKEKEVLAFLMFDLKHLGYSNLNENDGQVIRDLNYESRFFPAYQLAKTVDFLHRQQFIHADLDKSALWFHPEKMQLALIDFDSGYHYNIQKKATTLGKITYWASFARRKILGLGPNNKPEITDEERLGEENWVLASALFEIFFGVPPFFFLRDTEEETFKNYLKQNEWPEIREVNDLIKPDTVAAHQNIIKKLNDLEVIFDQLIKSLKTTFNQGSSITKSRVTASHWCTLLLEYSRGLELFPTIMAFQAEKNQITTKNETVQFFVEADSFDYLKIKNKILPLFASSVEIQIEDSEDVILEAFSSVGLTKKHFRINALKKQPVFNYIKASEQTRSGEDPVIISWDTAHTKKVQVEGFTEPFNPEDFITVYPSQKTTYHLIAVGFFDQETEKTITIDVVQPEIEDFNWNVNINEGIDAILVWWKTKNATKCFLTPDTGIVSTEGKINLRVKEKTGFKLTAVGLYGETTRMIQAIPFSAPIIESIFVKAPPIEVSTTIDTAPLRVNTKVPEVLIDQAKTHVNLQYQTNIQPVKINYDSFKLNFSVNNILPDFATKNELILPEVKTNWFSRNYAKTKNTIIEKLIKTPYKNA